MVVGGGWEGGEVERWVRRGKRGRRERGSWGDETGRWSSVATDENRLRSPTNLFNCVRNRVYHVDTESICKRTSGLIFDWNTSISGRRASADAACWERGSDEM